MDKVHLLIQNADWLVTMDKERRIFRDGAVAVRGDTILDVGKTEDLSRRYYAEQVIDASDHVVVPGMIDCHVHSSFQLSRGLADEVGEQKFLFERMYPYEGSMDEEDTYWSAMLCAIELLKHAVTAFVDPGNYHVAGTVRAVEETGIRCAVAKSNFDIAKSGLGSLPKAFIESTDEALNRSEEVVKKFNGLAGGRIRAFFSFRGLNNCTDELIIRMKKMADEYDTMVQTHCSFAQKTRDTSIEQHGSAEVERLQKLGVLGPNMLLGHVGWLTPPELLMMRDYEVKAVACPSSSLHNAYGNIMMGKIPELIEMGVPMGLGSDHASSGVVDMLQEMRFLALGSKETRLDPKIMPPEVVLEMSTIGGARAAMWDAEIGSLEPGKKADLVFFDTRRPEWLPLYVNPLVNLVYSATGSSVDLVMVGGRIVVQNGRMASVDEDAIYRQVQKLTLKILDKTQLGEVIRPKWPVV